MGLNDTPLTLIGQTTPRAVIYKHESHKLHQAFPVKVTDGAAAVIVKGQPVGLNTDGTVSPWNSSSTTIYLGIAVTDSVNPAYAAQRGFPVEVTVMVVGFAIVNWVANAANQAAGYVTAGSTLLNNRYVKASAASANTVTDFIALHPTTAANEVVQVLVR